MRSLNYLHRTLASYERDGIRAGDPDYVWNNAHTPTPKCELGTTTVPLIEANHFIHDIYQSVDFNRCCFFSGNVRRYLYGEGFLCENWFELVEIYEHFACGEGHLSLGHATYRNTITGEQKFMPVEEANASPEWQCVHKGETLYQNTTTGEYRRLSVEEAAADPNWQGAAAGKSCAVNPETGERRMMTPDEMEQEGWVPFNLGKVSVVDKSTNQPVSITSDEYQANPDLYLHFNEGKGNFRNKITGEVKSLPIDVGMSDPEWEAQFAGTTNFFDESGTEIRISHAEAAARGLELALTYVDPSTGTKVRTTPSDAAAKGLISEAKARFSKRVRVIAPDGTSTEYLSIKEAICETGLSNLYAIVKWGKRSKAGYTAEYVEE